MKSANPNVLVFYHTDGIVNAVIPEFIEIGIDILNPIQPECMDIAELKQQYGDRLSFWGAIGVQSTMPFGTPEDVRATVKHLIDAAGKGGGLVVARLSDSTRCALGECGGLCQCCQGIWHINRK